MQNKQMDTNAPPVTLSFEFSPSVYAKLSAHEPLREAVHTACVQQVAELMAILGIPGVPTMQIKAIDPGAERASYWMRLLVNGVLCRYSPDLLKRVHSYVSDSPLIPDVQAGPILHWFEGLSTEVPEEQHVFIAFLGHLCVEIIKKQPRVLLGLPQAVAYAASLPRPADLAYQESAAWPPEPEWLHLLLSVVLQLKISLAEREAVATVLSKHLAEPWEVASEALIDALRSNVVEIHLSQAYLRELTTNASGDDFSVFDTLRQELLRDFGLGYPDFRFVPMDYLNANFIAFKIHHLTLLPWKGLNADQLLANATTGYVQERGIEGRAVSNPYYGWENNIVRVVDKPRLETFCWSQLGYVKLCLAADLKEQGFCFVSCQQVQRQLGQVEKNSPALIQTVRSKLTIEQVTHVLRTLVMQGVSVKTLTPILERLLDYEYLAADRAQIGIIDNSLASQGQLLEALWLKDPAYMISFIRIGLKRSISNTYSGGGNTVNAYYLDPQLENLILERRLNGSQEVETVLLNEQERGRILDAIHTQIARLSTVDPIPLILTQIYTRPSLHEIVAAEIPRTAVLAVQEVTDLLAANAIKPVAILPFAQHE